VTIVVAWTQRPPAAISRYFKGLRTLRQRNEGLLKTVSNQRVGQVFDDFGRFLTMISPFLEFS